MGDRARVLGGRPGRPVEYDDVRTRLADALELATAAESTGLHLVSAGYDELDGLVPRGADPRYDKLHVALQFWDRWIDSSRHDWLHYEGMTKDSWPALGRTIVDDLRADRDIQSAQVLRLVRPPASRWGSWAERPYELRMATVLMCLFNVLGVFFYEPIEGLSATAGLAVYAALYAVLALVSFVVIWFFWNGRNWARWLVMAASVLAMTNVTHFSSSALLAKAILAGEAMLGAWLLFWLNTRAAKAFFARR